MLKTMAALLTFQKYNDPDLARAIGEQLGEAGIRYVIEGDHLHLDPVIIGNTPEPLISLKIHAADFVRAHALLEAFYEKQLDDIDPEYYLFTFTDQELLDILAKPDEWGHFDYVLARKLLIERGYDITPEFTDKLKKQRLEELEQHDDAGPKKTIPLLGVGMMSGYAVSEQKKILPDGREVYVYSPNARKRGRIFFILGIIALTLIVLMLLTSRNR
jgi:hypothetical protein